MKVKLSVYERAVNALTHSEDKKLQDLGAELEAKLYEDYRMERTWEKATREEIRAAMLSVIGKKTDTAQEFLEALVAKREQLESTLNNVWAVLTKAGISHGQTPEGLEQGLSVVQAIPDMVAALKSVRNVGCHCTSTCSLCQEVDQALAKAEARRTSSSAWPDSPADENKDRWDYFGQD